MKSVGKLSLTVAAIALATGLASASSNTGPSEKAEDNVGIKPIEEVVEKIEKPTETVNPERKKDRKKKGRVDTVPPPAPPAIFIPPPAPPPPIKVVEDPESDDGKGKKKKKRWRWRANDVLVSEDGKSLHVVGSFTSRLASRLSEQLDENPDVETVVLSSGGGLIIEGLAIGRLIEKNGLNTHVEFVCASSCTLAYLQGQKRSFSRKAGMGFHRAYKRSFFRSNEDQSQGGNLAMRRHYAAANVGQELIARTMETPSTQMWFPDVDTLIRNGFIDQVVEPGTTEIATGETEESNKLRDELDRNPMWAKVRKEKPDHYFNTMLELWVEGMLGKDIKTATMHSQQMLGRSLAMDARYYSDDIVDRFILLQDEINEEQAFEENYQCGARERNYVPAVRPNRTDLIEKWDALLSDMASAPVTRTELSDTESAEFEANMIGFMGKLVAETGMSSRISSRNVCQEAERVFSLLADMPQAERLSSFRALIEQLQSRRGFSL